MQSYLKKVAERWVSIVVLVGCALITATLVYTAFQAEALGNRYSDPENRINQTS
jgi:CHASE1-domain containing sensor protein